ncbi:hypothetical protein EON65_42595 [archaeon]|nr:MAG: hypothetical protein EON65_42595 [archaeon]
MTSFMRTRLLTHLVLASAAFGPSRMASFSASASASSEVCLGLQQAQLLYDITLQPVAEGRLLSGQPNLASQDLWADKPALIYVVRRPG